MGISAIIYFNFRRHIRFFSFLLLALLCPRIYAQPGQIHLSIAKSGEYSDIHITYISDQNLPQYVLYGKSLKLNKKVVASSSEFDGDFIYSTKLEKLSPSRTWFYKCGSEETGWSPVYSFKTAPKSGRSERIVAGILGDTQNNEFNERFGKTDEVVRRLEFFKPDLVLHMGDIVNNGSINTDWKKFLQVIQPVSTSAPLMVTLGNHDIDNTSGPTFQQPFPSFSRLYSMPGNGLDYSFDYGNVHFISIFSGIANTAVQSGVLRYGNDTREREWLENDLKKANQNRRTGWIIVFMHYPLYSFGWSNVSEWKKSLAPLLEKYNVDLCLAGHRHVYERHYPVKEGIPVKTGPGTVYITNGTAGGSPQGVGGSDLPTMAFTSGEKMYNYAIMKIEGEILSYEVYNLSGNKIDEFSLIKNK
jgi:predicted phosphohydrolase